MHAFVKSSPSRPDPETSRGWTTTLASQFSLSFAGYVHHHYTLHTANLPRSFASVCRKSLRPNLKRESVSRFLAGRIHSNLPRAPASSCWYAEKWGGNSVIEYKRDFLYFVTRRCSVKFLKRLVMVGYYIVFSLNNGNNLRYCPLL